MQSIRLVSFAAAFCLAACGDVIDNSDAVNPEPSGIIQAESLTVETITPDEILTPEEAAIRGAQANILMLSEYVTFLETVKAATGAYPETKSMRSAFNAMKDMAEEQGITLPEKPQTGVEENTRSRFAYRSDGVDYKLVAERTGDCFAVRDIDSARIDPKRASGPVDCYGYGFWTEGAETW